VTEPIGLSTSWNGPGFSPDRLLDEHRNLGFRRLEAYAHFSPEALRALAEAAQRSDMEIASLHGPCPVPAPLGDWLASTNAAERTRSVDALKGTIDAAVGCGAKAVVVHLGNAGVASRQASLLDVIAREGRLSDAHLRLRDLAWQEREAVKGPHLEAALESIRALGEHARGTGVRLGLECRDGYHEIPSLEEFSEVLAACDGLPVGYWHDAGHGPNLTISALLRTKISCAATERRWWACIFTTFTPPATIRLRARARRTSRCWAVIYVRTPCARSSWRGR
jgi:sugar phosphate isomerase/epimerase